MEVEPGFRGQNSILRAVSRVHHWQGVGPLSIKTFRGGQAHYSVPGALPGDFRVDDQSYLILNHAQPYTITIDAPVAVESFCIFFSPDLAGQVYYSLTTQPERLLDDPARNAEMAFFTRTHAHDSTVTPLIDHLREAYRNHPVETGWLEEQLHPLMAALLHVQRSIYREAEALPAARAATRHELYRRLHRARDFLSASYAQPLTLNEIAQVACLSPNHLLRTFKQAFGLSPHQYLTNQRIERARWLLHNTDLPVTEVCLSVGFDSLGSFSWLFRQRTGLSPQTFRQLKSL